MWWGLEKTVVGGLVFQGVVEGSGGRVCVMEVDYVIDSLVLKQVAGILTPQDVIDLNEWLQEAEG